jgi:hypothetical protein
MSKQDVNHAVYKLGFFAAKRRMMREIRLRFSHLRPIDQLDLKQIFRKVQP